MEWVLGQTNNSARLFDAVLWMTAIVALALGTGLILAAVRRRLVRPVSLDAQGFTLDQLRNLLDRGELSREEYNTLRQKVIATGRETARGRR